MTNVQFLYVYKTGTELLLRDRKTLFYMIVKLYHV